MSRLLTRVEYDKLKSDGKIWHHYDAQGHGVGYSSFSFELAMRIAAGRYAIPYLRLLHETNDLVAAALFPLCAHFALHSESPPEFFVVLVKRLAPHVDVPRGRAIEETWRALYHSVYREAWSLHAEQYGRGLATGLSTIETSALYDEHVGYRLAHTALLRARGHLEEHRPSDFLVGPSARPTALRASWTVDFLLGCCGMTAAREPDLLALTAPPVIRFADGLMWHLASAFHSWMSLTPEHRLQQKEIASALLSVDQTWNEMLLAVLVDHTPGAS